MTIYNPFHILVSYMRWGMNVLGNAINDMLVFSLIF